MCQQFVGGHFVSLLPWFTLLQLARCHSQTPVLVDTILKVTQTQTGNKFLKSFYGGEASHETTCLSPARVESEKLYYATWQIGLWWEISNKSSKSTGKTRVRTAQPVEHQTHDCKVTSSIPDRSRLRFFLSRVNFLCWLLFGAHSTSGLPQWHVKDPGHSAKRASGSLHQNIHANTLDST